MTFAPTESRSITFPQEKEMRDLNRLFDENPVPCNLLLIVKDIPVDVGLAMNSRKLSLLVAIPAEYPLRMLSSRLRLTSSETYMIVPSMLVSVLKPFIKIYHHLLKIRVIYLGVNQCLWYQEEFGLAGITPIHIPTGVSSARLRIIYGEDF
ncbi:LOW QUALITY PROTEIN: hypothetical protein HID58_060445 [Brassica napus]|uniref:Uncharacterized protein n=1 Tax=Brassica napus TaxID=3708 RepID=A0ABQ7ZVV3_BRANA|nr:LOW QUALITY PROTEIN: hypothetical protein HID58_060445 [Brassica napus]